MDTYQKRFWSKVLKTENENECWNWTGGCDKDGYGQFWSGNNTRAHRFAYEISNNKKIEKEKCILHSCDNVKCCNPKHLRVGTQQQNIIDKVSKKRQARGETSGRSKLTELQVLEIRERQCLSQRKLAMEFGISQTHIRDIRNRKTWKHIQ